MNALEARKAQGSVLEYGLKWHLERFVKNVLRISHFFSRSFQLKEGIPTDPRWPDRRDKYIDDQTKEQGLIVQWLENFKAKFGEIPEAKPTITEVEEALTLFNNVIGKIEIALSFFNTYFQLQDESKQTFFVQLKLEELLQNLILDGIWKDLIEN